MNTTRFEGGECAGRRLLRHTPIPKYISLYPWSYKRCISATQQLKSYETLLETKGLHKQKRESSFFVVSCKLLQL